MIVRRTFAMMCALSVAALLAGVRADAQTEQTGTQFYMAYRAAFQKAGKVEELFPFMGSAQRAQVEKTPADERGKMFELNKAFIAFTHDKVLKETKSATGATLEVEGIDSDKKKATASVELVKEGGAWKIGKESWKSGM